MLLTVIEYSVETHLSIWNVTYIFNIMALGLPKLFKTTKTYPHTELGFFVKDQENSSQC